MKNYIEIQNCRLCNKKKLKKIIDLGSSPIGNDLLKKKDLKSKVTKYPLSVNQCINCGHHQLTVSVNNILLYKSNYTYLTGTSSVFRNYLKNYAQKIVKKIEIKKNDLVIDIGSNDGTLLLYFKKLYNASVLGIDPSLKPSKIARQKKIVTINDFFTNELSEKIKKNYKTPKLITSHNTFAHVKNLDNFFRGIVNLSNEKTLVVIEIGYWLEVVKNNWFDTIYHEHHDFHSLKPLLFFFKKYNFNIIDFKITEPQGGSLMLILKKSNNFKIYKKIQNQINKEKKFGLYKLSFYKKIINNLQKSKDKINLMLSDYSENKKTICAYGSPTKSVTLLSFIKLQKNIIKNIYEDNVLKCNLYNPYMKIPIIHSSNIKKDNPDIILILSWNFAESIIKKVKEEYGKKIIFVVPLPEPYIIE